MESGNSLSMISLIMHASLPVQLIMALLVALSVISWSFIVSKLITLRAVGRSTDDFELTFWSGADLNSMYQRVSANQNGMGMEKIFQAGFGEFIKLRRQGGVELSDLMDGTRRAMKAAAQRELDELDRHTAFLATVGSVSPYIGLFGTVYGIMHAFLQLSGSQDQSTIDRVGPGIAEALFTTAIGLVAAIPAVMAFNYFVRRIRVMTNEMDAFGYDFLNIVRRHILKPQG